MIPTGTSSSILRRERIEQLCHQFEQRWNDSSESQLDSLLEGADSRDRSDLLVELVAIELELRIRKGEIPRLEEYTQRYAAHAARISTRFAEVVNAHFGKWRRAGKNLIPEDIGDFRIIREIGRGSMGIVYEAEQRSLKRQVALKVLPKMFGISVSRLFRFRRESEAIARLHHSNIVEIYGTGEQDGLHYFAMQFVDGQTLSHILDESSHPTRDMKPEIVGWKRVKAVAKVGKQIAEALAYAHERGVLHRDVKPANIIVDRSGNAWLTDFSLAKLSRQEEDSLSRDGDVVGTLRYIAPESLQGVSDPRSDVYSLGMTLYELITGRSAFTPKVPTVTFQELSSREPEPIENRVREVPRDFITIIHKAIDRRVESRYQTAGELAEDLRRFLAGEQVLARRLSLFEKASRWVSSNRILSASFAITTLLFALATIVSIFVARQFATAMFEMKKDAATWTEALDVRDKMVDERTTQRDAARRSFEQMQLSLVDLMMSESQNAVDRGRYPEALLWTVSAIKNSSVDEDRLRANSKRHAALLNRIGRPIQMIDVPHAIAKDGLTVHPGGSHVLVRPLDVQQPTLLYKVEKGSPGTVRPSSAQCFAWSKSGDLLAVADGKTVVIKSFPGMVAENVFQSHSEIVQVAFNDDSHLIAVGNETSLMVVDRSTGELVGAEYPLSARPLQLQFDSLGKWIAVTTNDDHFHIYRVGQMDYVPWVSSGQVLVGNESSLAIPRFLDGGRGVVTGDSNGDLEVWNLQTGTRVHGEFKGFQTREKISGYINSNVFLRDGKNELSGLSLRGNRPDDSSHVDIKERSNVTDGDIRSQTVAHRGMNGMANGDHLLSEFDSGQEVVVVTNNSPFATLYDSRLRVSKGVIATQSPAIRLADFSSNGSILATASTSNRVCIWSVPHDSAWKLELACDKCSDATIGRFSRDSKWMALTNFSSGSEIRIASTSAPDESFSAGSIPGVVDIVFSQESHIVIGAVKDSERTGKVIFWDWRNGKSKRAGIVKTRSLDFVPRTADALNLNADGTRLSVFGEKDELIVFNVTDLSAVTSFGQPIPGRVPSVGSAQMDTRGKVIFRISDSLREGRLFHLDRKDWSPRLEYGYEILNVAFSRNGERVATCTAGDSVSVWNTETSRIVCAPLPHPSSVYAAEFSDDGQFLLTACSDDCVRVWDIDSGSQVGTEIRGAGDLEACFLPGSHEILTLDSKGRFSIWHHLLSRQLNVGRDLQLSPRSKTGRTRRMTISPDGSRVLIADSISAHVIRLDDLDGKTHDSSEDLMLEAEVLSHHRFTESGQPSLMSHEEWRSKWERWIRSTMSQK